MKTEDVAVERLKEILGLMARCPMCGGNQFQVLDGFFSHTIQKSINSFQLGGQSVPCVALVCARCGFVSQHALGVLDREALSQKKEEK